MLPTDYGNDTPKQMLAYLRTNANKQPLQEDVASIMRDNVRNQRATLAGIDHRSAERTDVAGVLAEIYKHEFVCLSNNLAYANTIASRYHESAFDNTDDYNGVGQSQTSPDEMTSEQLHASRLLRMVGTNYSEISMAIRMLECDSIHIPRDIVACDDSVIRVLAQHFHTATNPSIAEDAFDRLHHSVKQVWNLINTMAFANLFRFAASSPTMFIASSDDSILIPHIPTRN
jgi:hypothetical protein